MSIISRLAVLLVALPVFAALPGCRPSLDLTVLEDRQAFEVYIGSYPAPKKRIVFSGRTMMDVLAQLGAVAHKKYIHFSCTVNPYKKDVLGTGTTAVELPLERVFYHLADVVPYQLSIVADTIVVAAR